MASKDSADDEIPSLNSIPPPDEGGVEEVTRVGSHAEIQKALEGESASMKAAKAAAVPPAPTPAAGAPPPKQGENIKTPTVPLPAVEIDKNAKVGKVVEELEDSALEAVAPSKPPPGAAPPPPPGTKKKPAAAKASDTSDRTSDRTSDTNAPRAMTTEKSAAAPKSNVRIILLVAVAVALVLAFILRR